MVCAVSGFNGIDEMRERGCAGQLDADSREEEPLFVDAAAERQQGIDVLQAQRPRGIDPPPVAEHDGAVRGDWRHTETARDVDQWHCDAAWNGQGTTNGNPGVGKAAEQEQRTPPLFDAGQAICVEHGHRREHRLRARAHDAQRQFGGDLIPGAVRMRQRRQRIAPRQKPALGIDVEVR